MSQFVLLAGGQEAETSTSFTVPAGESRTVSIASTTPGAAIPVQVGIAIRLMHNSEPLPNAVGVLSRDNWLTTVCGPGEYIVERQDISAHGVDVAVMLDDGASGA